MWLWAALSATACCFRIDPTRARPAAKMLLGEFDGPRSRTVSLQASGIA